MQDILDSMVDFFPNLIKFFSSIIKVFSLFFDILPSPFNGLFTFFISLIFGISIYKFVRGE